MSAADDIDLVAAEYALGTLDAAERANVSRRLRRDPDLERAVDAWEATLSPLSEATPEVTPPAHLYRGIEARLFGAPRGQLRLWQISTGAFAALAASLLAWIVVTGTPGRASDDRLVAVLQREAGAPAMVLDVDVKARRLTVRSIAAATPTGKSYELWLIDPAVGAPRPLGLVPPQARTETSLVSYAPDVISTATYAVTLEPAGGAPDGKPSGTPILSGKLVPTAP